MESFRERNYKSKDGELFTIHEGDRFRVLRYSRDKVLHESSWRVGEMTGRQAVILGRAFEFVTCELLSGSLVSATGEVLPHTVGSRIDFCHDSVIDLIKSEKYLPENSTR